MQPRKHNRYRLSAPVVFHWKDASDAECEGTGQIRDICLGGVFIHTEAPPPLKVPVQIELRLPKFDSAARLLLAHGDGEVIRKEPAGKSGTAGGFAAAFRRLSVGGRETKWGKGRPPRHDYEN